MVINIWAGNIMCALSCYNWSNGSKSGVWAFNLNNNRTNSNNNVGFRCDCAFHLKSRSGKSGAQGLSVQAQPNYASPAPSSRAADRRGGALI